MSATMMCAAAKIFLPYLDCAGTAACIPQTTVWRFWLECSFCRVVATGTLALKRLQGRRSNRGNLNHPFGILSGVGRAQFSAMIWRYSVAIQLAIEGDV
jgi:hypothetical protein